MTVYRNDGRWDTSNVEFDGGRIRAYDKRDRTPAMQHIDYGLGVFDAAAFDGVPDGEPCDLAAVYQEPAGARRAGRLRGARAVLRDRLRRRACAEFRRLPGEAGDEFRRGQFLAEAARDRWRRIDRDGDRSGGGGCWPTPRARGGRLFILGVGGSAANASHAVNDFRKIAGIEAYAPTDNVSELTARTNDEGWASVFEGWLQVSRLSADDAVLVFSVGGGNLEKNVSPNLVAALRVRQARSARGWPASSAATAATRRAWPTPA